VLASSIERVPSGERLIHEIKFDGYRVPLHIANESIRVTDESIDVPR
jgi:bifunctional non-homologous end joining protein LigD